MASPTYCKKNLPWIIVCVVFIASLLTGSSKADEERDTIKCQKLIADVDKCWKNNKQLPDCGQETSQLVKCAEGIDRKAIVFHCSPHLHNYTHSAIQIYRKSEEVLCAHRDLRQGFSDDNDCWLAARECAEEILDVLQEDEGDHEARCSLFKDEIKRCKETHKKPPPCAVWFNQYIDFLGQASHCHLPSGSGALRSLQAPMAIGIFALVFRRYV